MPGSKWRQSRAASHAYKADRQRGFALPETLIAAVIAASVTVAAAQSLGVAARTAHAAASLELVAQQSETITTRIDAGMSIYDTLDGMDGWEVRTAPYSNGVGSKHARGDARLVLWTLTHDGGPNFEMQLVRLGRSK